MTDQHTPLRPATMKDLQAILAHAAKNPAEQEKLAAAPEAALKQAGLKATTEAVEFLKSMGKGTFDETKQDTEIKRGAAGGAAEL